MHLKKTLGKFSVGVSDKSHDGGQGISGEWKSEVEGWGQVTVVLVLAL